MGASPCSAFIFFFSSRRRHTRWPRDWSSDVCSSDLPSDHRAGRGPRAAARSARAPPPTRSEERRVGKECRTRWAPHQQKKKTRRRTEGKRQKNRRTRTRRKRSTTQEQQEDEKAKTNR